MKKHSDFDDYIYSSAIARDLSILTKEVERLAERDKKISVEINNIKHELNHLVTLISTGYGVDECILEIRKLLERLEYLGVVLK